MGGGAPRKRETNSERNARILASKKGDGDARALREQAEFLRRSRRRNPLFGGPETGHALGGGLAKLGSV